MRKEELFDYHQKHWQNAAVIDYESIKPHINDFKRVDELVPPGPRFYLVINLHTYKYEYVGKGQQLLSGYSNEEVKEQGIKFQMDNIHPEDGEYILKHSYGKFTELLMSYPPEERRDLILQNNYRFRHKSGKILHLIEQIWVLKLDEQGGGLLMLAHLYQLPMMNPFKINVLIKKLLPNQTYETLYSNIYPEVDQDVKLSDREKEVVSLLTEGYGSKEIGEKLFISTNTVKTHRKNILSKLEMNSTNELVAFAITNGLV